MDLPLEDRLKIGINTMHRRTEPATGPWLPRIDELVAMVEQVDRLGYDSFWCGDHIAFARPFFSKTLSSECARNVHNLYAAVDVCALARHLTGCGLAPLVQLRILT